MSWIAPLDAAIIIAFITVVALSWIASESFEWRYRRILLRARHPWRIVDGRLDVPFIRTPGAPAALNKLRNRTSDRRCAGNLRDFFRSPPGQQHHYGNKYQNMKSAWNGPSSR